MESLAFIQENALIIVALATGIIGVALLKHVKETK